MKEDHDGWHQAIESGGLADEAPVGVEIAGQSICLYRAAGAVYATDDICTHAFAHLSDGFQEGEEIECPLHQGRFNIRTGEALCAPVSDPIRIFKTQEKDGWIWVYLQPE